MKRIYWGGVNVLKTTGKRIALESWEDILYKPYSGYDYRNQELKFVPYYAWTNRSVGEMIVWVKVYN